MVTQKRWTHTFDGPLSYGSVVTTHIGKGGRNISEVSLHPWESIYFLKGDIHHPEKERDNNGRETSGNCVFVQTPLGFDAVRTTLDKVGLKLRDDYSVIAEVPRANMHSPIIAVIVSRETAKDYSRKLCISSCYLQLGPHGPRLTIADTSVYELTLTYLRAIARELDYRLAYAARQNKDQSLRRLARKSIRAANNMLRTDW